jgi:hypothetical protein
VDARRAHRGRYDEACDREWIDSEQLSRGLRNARWADCLRKKLLDG